MIILLFALSGLVSGILSYRFTVVPIFDFNFPPAFYVPGVVFGLCIGLMMIGMKYARWFFIFPWVIISSVSYYSAVMTTIKTTPSVPPGEIITPLMSYTTFFLGGLVGAFCMLIGFRFFMSRLSLASFMLLAVLGGILGLSWFLGGKADFANDPNNNFFWLYVMWQTGMALGLGVASSRQEQKTMIR